MKLNDFDDLDDFVEEVEEEIPENASEFDFDEDDRPVRRTRKKNPWGVIAVLLVIIAMAVIIVLAYLWISNNFDSLVVNPGGNSVSLGNKELEVMLEDAYNEGYAKGQEEATERVTKEFNENVLGGIRGRLEAGDSFVRSLRPYYPKQLLITNNGGIRFVEIDDSLKKNDLSAENVKMLDSGEWQYFDGLIKKSHKGIDVSKHQGEIDWKAVKKDDVDFAFLRCAVRGYETGALVEDEFFRINAEAANAEKIHIGAYVFSQAITEEEAIEEAQMAINLCKDYKVDCPIVYDVEKVSATNGRMNLISVEERTANTIAFCEKVKEAGYKPMIYFNLETAGCLVNLADLEAYEKWFASYSIDFYYPYDYSVLQYASDGHVNGVNGEVDLNMAFKKIWE